MVKFRLLFFLPLIFSCSSLKNTKEDVLTLDLKSAYDKVSSNGVFLLKDIDKKILYTYNSSLDDTLFVPASTFKIVNSIIALETGTVSGIHDTLKWDGVIRDRKEWNRDSDMKNAFANSTVWFYQELAKKIGVDRMRFWLDTLKYGSGNIYTIDKFWLNGELKISPKEQLQFLVRFLNRELPLSSNTYACLEEIMRREEKEQTVLFGKTGWGFDGNDVGWFVGFVRSEKGTYVFTNLMWSSKTDNPDFGSSRINIVKNVLSSLGIMPH
jgi:beta-lactamase class D